MNTRQLTESYSIPDTSSKNPQATSLKKHGGNSNQGRFTRKPAINQTHKRKGLNLNKNNQIELMQSNVLSSLKSDLQQLQSQMIKLNNDQQIKPHLYAKTMTNSNAMEQINVIIPNKNSKSQMLQNQSKSTVHLGYHKSGLKSPTNNECIKQSSKGQYQYTKQSQKWKQKAMEFHFQQQIRNKNVIIQELERRLESIKQNYQNQITQVLKEKMDCQKSFKLKIEELINDKNRLINEHTLCGFKQQQIISTKHQLELVSRQLHSMKLQKLELKKDHQDIVFKLQSEIYSLKLSISQHAVVNLKGKETATQQIINEKITCNKKMVEDNSYLTSEIKSFSEMRSCAKCIKNQQIITKFVLLSEENQQLRNSIDTFFKQFKADTQQSTKVLNPQLQHQLQKKNMQIQNLSHKVKHIEALAIELHTLDKKYKTLEYLLQESNEDLLRTKLRNLNSFYK